ncbi:MAG: Amidinotransferase [Patescibacteria group bacterium]|nr:Amidinotransferase [Patescibacteria group bacterium]
MSGTDYFSDDFAINPYMDSSLAVDRQKANQEHQAIQAAFKDAGIAIETVAAPPDCQDGVYTANWALTRGNMAVMSSLPNKRQAEEPHAKEALENLGFVTVEAPFHFSGQGDALPCGDLVFMGSRYRTDPQMHRFIAETLGYQVIGLQTVPSRLKGVPVVNAVTGWPDSFFYDIDLALSVLTPNLIAWCPEAFVPESQNKIERLPIDKIEVSLEEATKGFACNLVSSGETVIMSAQAPELKKAIEAHGLKTITPAVSELAKGGGYIRCVSLTLDNA